MEGHHGKRFAWATPASWRARARLTTRFGQKTNTVRAMALRGELHSHLSTVNLSFPAAGQLGARNWWWESDLEGKVCCVGSFHLASSLDEDTQAIRGCLAHTGCLIHCLLH